MGLLKDMKGLFRGGGAISLLISSGLLITVSAFIVNDEDLTPPSVVQPWEEAIQNIKPQVSPEDQAAAVDGLVKRLLPDRASEFSFSVDPFLGPEGKDSYQVVSPGVNASVDVVGTSGVAAASGLLHYLKYTCNAHVSWEADQLALPESLPPAEISVTSNDRFRYYQNVCTVSYSMAWWKWSRWEREIDWMALNGFNMPLAFTGQEAIWQRVYTKLGVTQEELDHHFAGPAFLAWGRMGNIFGWGGPLPQSWHSQTLALQHQILDRMRQFGMTPILPAFAGHVPAGLTRVFPDANITRLGSWSHFNCTYSCTYLLDPNDPLFKQIGSKFITELTSEFGTDHLYNCDTFNEMTPSSDDPAYLSSVGVSVFEAMTTSDPSAIWVMQGWLFFNAAIFWRKPQAKALLTSVPLGRMLVLDLASEVAPQYSRLESYFGQPFIFCMLHDYGGVDGFFGNVDDLLNNMVKAREFPNVTLVGTGLTPEGINQNYVMYDLMNELAWRSTIPNVISWVASYASRRYNSADSRLAEAWQLLMTSVYNDENKEKNHGNYVIMRRPDTRRKQDWIWYSVDDVIKAWDLVIEVIRDSLEGDLRRGTRGRQSAESEERDDELKGRRGGGEEDDAQQQLLRDPSLAASLENLGEQQRINSVDRAQNPLPSDRERKNNHTPTTRRPMNRTPIQRTETSGDESLNDQNPDGILITYCHSRTESQGGKSPDNVHDRLFATDVAKTKEVIYGIQERDDDADGDGDDIVSQGYGMSEVTLCLLEQPTFLHDVVDITRQILQILGGQVALRMIDYYHNGDKFGVQVDSNNLKVILEDLDLILATSPDFLLGDWTKSAASWATNEQERELYVYNALNQVTIWGPDGEIIDYAIKQWSGLIANYIQPRWDLFGKKLVQSLEEGVPFDRDVFNKEVFEQVEEPLSRNVNASYPSEPKGDTIATALLLHAKYRPFFNETLFRNPSEETTPLSPMLLATSSGLEVPGKKMMKPSVNKFVRSSGSVEAMKKGGKQWGRLNVNDLLDDDDDDDDDHDHDHDDHDDEDDHDDRAKTGKGIFKMQSRESWENSIWNLIHVDE